MIVIATNNGNKFLKKSLDNLSLLNCDIPISIIDTKSTEKESIEFLNSLKNNYYDNLNINVYQTPYSGYDSGAYIYAMKNIDSDRFYFIHDSFIIKTLSFFDRVNDLLKSGVVVSILEFSSNLYDNQEQINFSLKSVGTSDYDKGVFGPMFSILKSDVNKIIESLDFYPKIKNEQMAMERIWPIIFKKNNINTISLCGYLDIFKIQNDKYEYFIKYLPHRDYKK